MLQTELTIAESATAEWDQWDVTPPGRPQAVRSLGQGLSNQSYLLESGETRMVLRINNTDRQLPGIDRQREAAIWRAAHEVGIAPQLLHADDRYLVSAYVPSEASNSSKIGSATFDNCPGKNDLVDEVFRLIEMCHAIEIETQTLDYAQHIQTYWAKIDRSANLISTRLISPDLISPDLINQRQPMLETLQALANQQQKTVLCHHDPVMANFVGTAKHLYLIDWEYAAKGMAVMDYAALAVEWGFSDLTICARTDIRHDSLVMAKNLYRYMCQLWEAAQIKL